MVRVVPFNDSPEHCKLLAEQMDRAWPVELTPEDDASFSEALEDMERWFDEGPERVTIRTCYAALLGARAKWADSLPSF